MGWLAGLVAAIGLWACDARSAGGPAPLALTGTIPLAGVAGRIDHLTIDAAGKRLFVSELGNGTVEAIDLVSGRSLGRIGGLREPQGVGYLPDGDELAVASGGDGMLRFYGAADLKPVGALKLGEDADNVRVAAERVLVGYGEALAVVDPANRKLVGSVPLPAHPEGFQVDGDRAIVNLPKAGGIAVADLARGRETARWKNPGPHLNFPMALEPAEGRIAVVYRLPARLVLLRAGTGAVEQQLDTCGDADDVFFDRAHGRLYVICGAGAVDVFARRGVGYDRLARIPTRSGARTGYFSPELGLLLVAAPARGNEPAAILEFRAE